MKCIGEIHSRLGIGLGLVLLPAAGLLAGTVPASALTMKECSAKYDAAKSAGTLKGVTWKTFRTSQCGEQAPPNASTAPAPTTAASTPAGTSAASTEAAKPAAPNTGPAPATSKTAAAGTSSAATSSPATFPSAVAAKYAGEKPSNARLHTCLDQYRINKTANANGGMRWIQEGGGYYSQCVKRLKPS